MARNDTRDQVLGHSAEADGIEEYDNPLPTWWLGLFYFTIGWGIVYGVHYHFIGGRSQAGEYEAEAKAFAEMYKPDPAKAAAIAANADPAAGKAVFEQNCVACHGADAHGGVGPNLTDADWIHGGTLPEITNTVTNGVTEKGMLAWGPILGPEKVAQVAAYVHSLGGGK